LIANFQYNATTFSKSNNLLIPFATCLQIAGGIFTSDSNDLIINNLTGQIDLKKSKVGTYKVTYRVGVDSKTIELNITL
tara:strand:- start:1502 stop:1738 length:237 start_codon:yes stop_codon:yes gene_type:complete